MEPPWDGVMKICSNSFSNLFSPAQKIKAKFHMEPPLDDGMKNCSNIRMTKMAAMPIYV